MTARPNKKTVKRHDPKVVKLQPIEGGKRRIKIDMDAMSIAARLQTPDRERVNPFLIPEAPSWVKKAGLPSLAMDSNFGNQIGVAWAANVISTQFSEGLAFLGYPYLSELAQRPEYRVISEVWAGEMTRKWMKLQAVGDVDKTDRIKELTDYLNDLKVRDAFYHAANYDGLMGRDHVFLEFNGDSDDREELKKPVGDGASKLSKTKCGRKNRLTAVRPVEAVWCYPTNYDSVDPLKPNWYRPTHWFVMGKEIHVTRLPTFVGRPVPDMLKPAYSFGGLSMSQMAKPYVDNWLETRQAVNDIIKSFTTWVLKTNLSESLTPGGEQLFRRVALFTLLKQNKSLMLLDKDTEEFENISAQLGTLDALQAQAQEHMASVSRIPLVKLLGISPTGLNASSEGEIRVFYDTIHAFQEWFFGPHLKTVVNFAMLSLWDEIDEDITISWEPLWSLDEKGEAEVREIEARTGASLIESGVISQEEERTRIAKDPDTPYPGLNPDDVPDLEEEEQEGLGGAGKEPGGKSGGIGGGETGGGSGFSGKDSIDGLGGKE